MNDYEVLLPAEVACLDHIAAARWAHTTALDPTALRVLHHAGYITITDRWVHITPTGWDLYETLDVA